MKQDELVKRILAGEKIICGEYRATKAETITWRDKETRKVQTAPLLRHTVECANESLTVSERVTEDFDPKKYVAPYKKGQRCVIHLQELKTERGLTSARGVLELIEA